MEKKFEKMIIEHCAPTLAKIKVANLFSFMSSDPEKVYQIVNEWNKKLQEYGINITVLKECKVQKIFLIYIYRKQWLQKILINKKVKKVLDDLGYDNLDNCQYSLRTLSYRLCVEKEFPHEIGIFLGYPLNDVIGFIKYKGRNYTHVGYWKSYSDPKIAFKIYDLYKNCFDKYKKLYEKGKSIKQLIIAA